MAESVSVTVSGAPPAGGIWSPSISFFGWFGMHAASTIDCTWTVQLSLDSGVNWEDYASGILAGFYYDRAPVSNVQYRIGVLLGDWGSGSNVLTLLRGKNYIG